MKSCVLVKSRSIRFSLMRKRLEESSVPFEVIDFDNPNWLNYDFSNCGCLIYFPTFLKNTASIDGLFPALVNIPHIVKEYPHLRIFPDPGLLHYYNDKYAQYLFLKAHGYPIPPTIPVTNNDDIKKIIQELGLPLILKNRHGAGGNNVFLINTIQQLQEYVNVACGHLSWSVPREIFGFSQWIKNGVRAVIKPISFKRTALALPLLAQKKITTDRDIRIVVIEGKVWEAHWRIRQSEKMWKTNIDAGGIGVWSYVPPEILKQSEQLAENLQAKWIAFDVLFSESGYYFTEFSPVWHHYFINEHESFEYRDDYNIGVSIEEGHDYEGMIMRTICQ